MTRARGRARISKVGDGEKLCLLYDLRSELERRFEVLALTGVPRDGVARKLRSAEAVLNKSRRVSSFGSSLRTVSGEPLRGTSDRDGRASVPRRWDERPLSWRQELPRKVASYCFSQSPRMHRRFRLFK